MSNRKNQGGSLSKPLAWSVFLRQLGIFVTIDLILLSFSLLGTVMWAEYWTASAVAQVEELGVPSAESVIWSVVSPYKVYPLDRDPEGSSIFVPFDFSQNTKDGLRNYNTFPLYTSEFYDTPTSYTVVVDLKLVFRLLGVIWNLMLFWQGISIFINILGTTKSIQRTLRPIQELTATTMRLHATKDPTKIEMAALTGALEKISAIDLDSRISLTETQRELQPLAQAINAMLDRVSQSYEVQMRFVSDASHELRTPIAVIKGYSDMLDRWGKSDSDALQEGIDAIHSESRSMERLVEQLLFLARGDNLSQPVKKESIDLTELAAQIIREERIRNPSREITTSWTSPLITVADPTLIKQVLRILMDNSMKYSKDRIWFTLKHTESTIIISLEDEGMGIPTDSIPHIFDRFYRSDRSRTRQTGGTGLGLSIALWIAEQHNGWFTVISREGIGTKLSLHLPFSPTELPKTI